MYLSQEVFIFHYSIAQECNEADIRLVDNERVQICLEGNWNSLCGDNWDDTEAIVACKQLGHTGSQFTGAYKFIEHDFIIILQSLVP